MSNIFKPLHSQQHLTRNAFDLSHRSVFSNRVGLLQPCLVMEVNPNEHFDVSIDAFVRTAPLNTAAFSRVRHNIDFFFVPYRVLWHNFGNSFTGTAYKSRNFDTYGISASSMPSISKDYFEDLCTILQQEGKTDMFGFPAFSGFMRLGDMLGYGFGQFASNPTPPQYSISPFRFLAYQKIYQDFYRNPLYEVMDADSYCLDYLGNSVSDISAFSCNYKWFLMRYASWKRDYFTCLRPSFNGADFISQYIRPINFSSLSFTSPTPSNGFPNINPSSIMGDVTVQDVGSQFSVGSLRAAFALDKLQKLMERAHDGSYSAQIEARFGVKPRSDGDESIFIGAFDSPVSIGEVVSTADTTNGKLGEALGHIAGKGYVNQDGHFEFDSNEQGIIMGIQSFVPEADYSSYGCDRANTFVSSVDFFQPEFDDLGYEPHFVRELTNFMPKTTGGVEATDQYNTVLGFSPRYLSYKTIPDKVHGAFCRYGSLSAWTSPRDSTLYNQEQFTNGLSTQFFKVSPYSLDSIFAIEAVNGEEDLYFDNDQFWCTCDFHITALRPMSIYGLPNI